MIIFKVLLQGGMALSALLIVYLDYKWHDKRTKRFKYGRRFLVILMLVILFASVFITINDDIRQTEEKQELSNSLNGFKIFPPKIGLYMIF